ncbi:MAG: rhodanese-like domain-containing protein [Candidatus Aureabacteria bacterium]|nr:rhodanese-like domain-containing protein [Candidatus Auribacterota bacterium]
MPQKHHPLVRSVIEAAVVLAIGSLAGVVNNAFSSHSIPCVGEWDKTYGVPSPGGEHAATHGNREIGLAEARRLFENGAVFVDARPAGEYREGHVAGAISIPEDEFRLYLEEVLRVGEERPMVVAYCRGMECDEAHLLAGRLHDAGINEAVVFAGGLTEWSRAGLPVEKGGGGNVR